VLSCGICFAPFLRTAGELWCLGVSVHALALFLFARQTVTSVNDGAA
jgi:hypothetical protein